MGATSNPGIRKGKISIAAIYYQVHLGDFLHIALSKRIPSSTIFALLLVGTRYMQRIPPVPAACGVLKKT